jgi:hypothetical protein
MVKGNEWSLYSDYICAQMYGYGYIPEATLVTESETLSSEKVY